MIPLKIEKLLAGRVVEQNRVEYKEGWNPNDIIHSICAYANDYHNMNGGYLVLGVKANDGIPELPPKGLPESELDSIQQEIFQYCNQIVPRYIPKIEVVNYQEKGIYLIYLWCTAGDSGPYQAPVDVYAKKAADKRMQYWIRPASLTTAAKQDEIAELFDKFNSVPFDDRVNRKATIEMIRRGYVEDYLKESNSSLVDELNTDTLEELLVATEVANSTDTGVDIRNIGVLMFTERPDKLIPGA
jgi:ATP-dependent DNA helicase RecG